MFYLDIYVLVDRLCGFPVLVRILRLQVTKNSTNRHTELKWHMAFRYGLIQKLLTVLVLWLLSDDIFSTWPSSVAAAHQSKHQSAGGTVQRMQEVFCCCGPRRNPKAHSECTGWVTCPPRKNPCGQGSLTGWNGLFVTSGREADTFF